MLPEIALETLCYLDRETLEGLQVHSRYLRELVNCHQSTLPLRYIHAFQIIGAEVYIQLLEDEYEEIMLPATGVQDMEILFYRVNNAFVYRLELSFRAEDLPVPCYFRAKADDLQCPISVLRVSSRADVIDYELVNFLSVHLKPQVYETWMGRRQFRENHAMLFTYNALRSNVSHVLYDLDGPAAPECIIPELFGMDVAETCAIATEIEPRPWISKFIETFQMAARGSDVVHSVALLHTRYKTVWPLHRTVEPLGQPRRRDAPRPHIIFFKKWLREKELGGDGVTITESSVAQLFVFDNANSAKKLEVFVWTILQSGEQSGFHYAFLLRVVDV